MFAFESDELRAEWRRCIYCKTIQSDAVLTVPKVSHPRVSTPLATVIQLQNEEEDGFRAIPVVSFFGCRDSWHFLGSSSALYLHPTLQPKIVTQNDPYSA